MKEKGNYDMMYKSNYVYTGSSVKTSSEVREMFQKKQKIYSETQGVCIVENIVQLPAGKGEILPYYVLKSILDEKTSYIPVNNHQVNLRELFTIEEAQELLKNPELGKNQQLKAAVEYVLQSKE